MNTSDPGRFFESDVSTIPVIRGIQDYDTALMWHQEAIKHDVDSKIKTEIAEKLRELDR